MAQERPERFGRGIYRPNRKSPLSAAESVQRAIANPEDDPERVYPMCFLYFEASFL